MHKNWILLLLCCLYLRAVQANNIHSSSSEALKTFYKTDSLFQIHKEDDMKEALRLSIELGRIAQNLQIDSLMMRSLFYKGTVLHTLGFMDLALRDLLAGVKVAQKIKRIDYLQKYALEIGRTYQSLADYENSLKHIHEAKRYAVQNKNYEDTLICNYEIAFNYVMTGKEEEGLSLMKQNVKVAKKHHFPDAIMLGLDNLSNILAELNRMEESLSVELELLNYKEYWDSNYYKTGIYDHFGEIYVALKQWDKAQQYMDSTFKYAQLIKSNDWLFEYYKSQSKIDEARGNYKSALENHKKYLSLKDSVYQENYDVKMAAMTAYHDLEAKQNEIALLEKDNAIQKNQRNAIILLGLFAVMTVAAFFVWRNQKEKQKLQLIFSQQLIQSQEAEKQRISKELHDSIGQNVLFIKNQLSNHPSKSQLLPVITATETTLEEVRNIAKDLYPNQLEKYGLSAAVETLGEKVTESSGVFVSADFQDTETQLSKSATIHIYRIIQECINNTLKHAQATAIRITAERQKGSIHFIIQDNGKGFDIAILAHKQQRSFGLLGMEERVKMLGGQILVESKINSGTKLSFSIPYV